MLKYILFLFSFLFLIPNIVHAEDVLKAAFNRHHELWVKIGDKEIMVANQESPLSPEWSDDGKWLAYSKRTNSPEVFEIWVYNSQTGKSYHVIHGGGNFQWARDQDILAFQFGNVLNVKDFRGEEPSSFSNVALGVDNFSWLPNGRGFLAIAGANLHPDGWTNPILYKIRLNDNLHPDGFFMNAKKFFTIPGHVKKDGKEILSTGTSRFLWSPSKDWIAFIVNPTASWSMDSNLLCALSSDGKTFKPVDEMASGFKFQWAPGLGALGYIEGGGRIVFGFKNKHLKVMEFPGFQSLTLTPQKFADLSFTWRDDEYVFVSRTQDEEWSNDPAKRALPVLVGIHIQNKTQKQVSFPPKGFGDFHPVYLQKNGQISWIRSNWKKYDVWLAGSDGSHAREWVKGIDYPDISWYNPGVVE